MARIAPAEICPWAPMLNSPARNPRATDSPARMNGVAVTTVSDSGPKDRAIWRLSPDWMAWTIWRGLPSAPLNSAL